MKPNVPPVFQTMPYTTGNLLLSALFLLLFLCGSGVAGAQCDTFHNADEANPLQTHFQYPTKLALDFVDINGDGLKDYYTSPDGQALVLYRNTGTASHPKYERSATSGFENVDYLPLVITTIQFRDFDGDGDYDCAMSDFYLSARPGYAIAGILYYQNTGTATAPHFERGNSIAGFAHMFYNIIAFSFDDIDNDGDYDLNYTGSEFMSPFIHYTYLNTGTKTTPAYTLYEQHPAGSTLDVDIYYDWNKDGLPDRFAGGYYYQNSSYYENIGPREAPQFQLKTEGAPVFLNGSAVLFTDGNGDGFAEAYSPSGNYSTQAPVAVIDTGTQTILGRTFTKLQSRYQQPGYTYNWQFNGKKIPGYHKPFLTAPLRGVYVLSVSSGCGTGLSLPFDTRKAEEARSDNLIVAAPLSSPVTITAYPNPFVSEFTVQLPSVPSSAKRVVRITDLAGRVLLTQQVSSTTLHTGRTLRPGTYLLQVWQDNKVIYRTKLIKQ